MKSNTTVLFSHVFRSTLFATLCLVLGSVPVTAQPSGGPYGPMQLTYKLPDVQGKIYYVAPNAQADASGETLEEPATLATAFERVKTGDAVILRGSVVPDNALIIADVIS